MALNITRIIRRFRELTDVIATALTAGNNGKSLAMTWDDSAQTLTLTKDPAFDTVVLPDGRALPVATASRTFYVATTGSDSNDGSIGSPFLTIQKAIDTVAGIYWGAFDPIISVADAGVAYSSFVAKLVFASAVYIVGNTANPANVVISGSICIYSDKTTTYNVSGVKLNATGQCVFANGPGVTIRLSSLILGSGVDKIVSFSGAQISLSAITCDAGGNTFAWAATNSIIDFYNGNVIFTGSPAFAWAVAYVQSGGQEVWPDGAVGNVFGSVIGTKYNISGGSLYAPQFVPGTGGTVSSPGVLIGPGAVNSSATFATAAITNTTASTSTTTGALTVAGGVGVAGAGFFGGLVNSAIGFVGPYLRPLANSTTALRIQNADGSTTLQSFDTTNNRVGHPVFSSFTEGAQFGSDAPDFGGGAGAIIGLDNAATVPTSNPTDGGILYVEGGELKYRGSSGTVTTIAPA